MANQPAYLDTPIVAWLGGGKISRLSRRAQAVIDKSELLLSPAAFLELEYLYELKRIRISARDTLLKVANETGLRLCEFPFASISSAALDEKWTRDPFDRLIVAHAKANGFASLISADEEIARHYPRTIW